jgi:hypothetical protein
MDSVHPFWQQQMIMMPTQGNANVLRQESSPAAFLGTLRESEPWNPAWMPVYGDKTQAAPPVHPDQATISNPFAAQGASEELVWTKNARPPTPTEAKKPDT